MAKPYPNASNPTYVIVEKGDTLSEIAQQYGNGKSAKQIAQISGNNIPNIDLIYIGQKIYVTGNAATSPSPSGSSNKVTIQQFGLQNNTEKTLFVTYKWGEHKNTDHYIVRWLYGTGDDVAFVGAEDQTKELHALHDIPAQASTRIICKVKPISKTKPSDKANGKETVYFTAEWSDEQYYYIKELPPTKDDAGTPSITKDEDSNEMTVRLDVPSDSIAKKIEFEVVINDKSVDKINSRTVNVVTGTATYKFTATAGNTYKVRCRAINDNGKGEWSDYSGNAETGPSTPAGIISIKATSSTAVYLNWFGATNAEGYEVEYATNKDYFDNSNQSPSTANTTDTHANIYGLESGKEYFFRVRAVKGNAKSGWTGIRSITIGKPPAAPTTYSSTTTAIVGEEVTLFWAHNAKDESKQTCALVTVKVNGTSKTYTVASTIVDEDEETPISSCIIDTNRNTISWTTNGKTSTESLPADITEGATLEWWVKTSGATGEFGDESAPRTIYVYARPYFTEFDVTDIKGTPLETLTSFPIFISAAVGPNTQKPIGYHLRIVSNEVYETTDEVGNVKMVNKGEEVYSNFFDTTIVETLDVILDAGNVDLQNNILYTVYCTASMDTGLTAETFNTFSVRWADVEYRLNAEIAYDDTTYVTHIRPYCENHHTTYYKVNYTDGKYVKTSTAYYSIYHDATIAARYTTTGEQVYSGTTPDNEEIYYCEVDEETPVENVLLSVYRREFDGSFTRLSKDVDNNLNMFVTDPHPALDYARYRIVAKDDKTGAISFYDVPGYPIGEKAIIIQWDEAWSNFESGTGDVMADPPWSGSLLRLPYNIKVSDKNAIDVSLVEYIGRKRPVTYYGTQLGETSIWSTAIPKTDEETLYGLRRLAIYTGDVYVREPSGTGYWANVSVSWNQEYLATTIPVTIDITRVEGGV